MTPVADLITPRVTEIAPGVVVRRALPTRALRQVGAWCFLDHFGPVNGSDMQRFSIGAHPHIGLQTATWLFEGALLHRDSIGSEQLIRAGELNLMTAGQGIAHSEQLGPEVAGLHGLQFWIALPDHVRHCEPRFEHHDALPRWRDGEASLRLFVGRHGDQVSPAMVHSPLIGLEVQATLAQTLRLPLATDFEHAVYVARGSVQVDDQIAGEGQMLSLVAHAAEVRLMLAPGTLCVLLGGVPFTEPLMMWWNFVARESAEIETAREDWQQGRRFGTVIEGGSRIDAPSLDLHLRVPARP